MLCSDELDDRCLRLKCSPGEELSSIEIRPQLSVLGTTIDMKGSNDPVWERRRSAGDAAFWKDKKTFCCREAPVVKKIEGWMAGPCGAFLFNSGTWTTSKRKLEDMKAWEIKDCIL